ncbi:hypothetical protein [Sphingomonas bacterium]|nr:hypothetical protein [Sphingomonas bacterium]
MPDQPTDDEDATGDHAKDEGEQQAGGKTQELTKAGRPDFDPNAGAD